MDKRAAAIEEPRRVGPRRHGWARVGYLLRRSLQFELAGWRSLCRVLTARPRVPRGASAHSYDRPVRAVLIVFLVLSAVEVPIVDLLAHPWPWVRYPLLVVGVWGVVTMLAMLLGNLSRPHAVGPDGIRVRSGAEVDLDLPWSAIASVSRRRRPMHGAPSLSLTGSGRDQALHQLVQDATDIDIDLEEPTRLRLPQGEVTVSSVRISVDDVDAFLAAVRTHIP